MNVYTQPQQSHSWNGTTYRILLSSAETQGAMSIVHGVAGPLDGPPSHIHEAEDETFLVLEGVIDFELEGTVFRRGPMETAHIPRGKRHSFRTGPDGAVCIAVLTPGGFEGFFEEVAAAGFQIPRDIAAVAECAARYGSQFTGPGLAQRG
ncbi:cupin domain-containing protein [Rhizobium leguminosarum bv. viciae]|uniref:cupin domain-containing protein n=1 Tax=Rhizobium ruizarguesonis TaxID=2081791 RepID=UPI00143F8E10|nr:cupin domain-containing protein [Rhizobium ruizarguesonis]NKJ71640.1 cupin domain-containing protein [Rhizobium leguminosarum bv. viciae]NKQ71196.1 cupin domain-containing protein [Rhizobium ruizarguesonis]NKQ81027.1 cupin domain-containing protein [Rhizobium ruizarguesonis]